MHEEGREEPMRALRVLRAMQYGRGFPTLLFALAVSACTAPGEPLASTNYWDRFGSWDGYRDQRFNGFMFPDEPTTVVLTLEQTPYTWGPVRILSADGKSSVVLSQEGVSVEGVGSSTPPSGSEAQPSR
jgi:hypothetical protein